MHKHVLFALAASTAGAAAAQGPLRPDPADSAAKVPAIEYRSVFEDYRADREQRPVPWREANDEMGRLGGHVGHVPGSVPPAKPAPKPPAHADHGGRK